MADNTQRPIVIKRIKKKAAGHHGGAWKIAYADFVTAMMAFFLLMWLLGSTTKGDLKGISDFFQTPLKISLNGGTGAGDASSLINAGGTELTRNEAQRARDGELPERRRQVDLKAAQAGLARAEAAKMRSLKAHLEEIIDASPLLRQHKKQLLIDFTTEGLRIQIIDEQNRPMFDLGSAQLKPYARDILLALSKPLNEVNNRISLSGHTDAKPYASGERSYSNWELSAERANASRRVLVTGGIDDGKIKRVVGMASAVPFDVADPESAANRRIAITVLTRQAEDSLNKMSGALNVSNADELSKEALDAKPR